VRTEGFGHVLARLGRGGTGRGFRGVENPIPRNVLLNFSQKEN
jgi:hypothetical protein